MAPKLLLIRMDKIGDLVLSLSIDQAPVAKACETTWLISQGTGFVPSCADPRRSFLEFSKQFSFKNVMQMVAWLRHTRPDIAVVLHAPWWVLLALWAAQVPFRTGRLSQWHSFLFLNRGLRQSRKSGDRHEADLNLELMQMGLRQHPKLNHIPLTDQTPPLKLNDPRSDLNIQLPARYVVVHPGMAGSALNWPSAQYAELIERITALYPVAVTGTAIDQEYIRQLKNLCGQNQNIIWLNEKLNATQLLTVLASAAATVAPSTGVLHLAASLGKPAIGLYSSIPVQRASRWGPRGKYAVAITTPAAQELAARDPKAAMQMITVDEVFEKVHPWLK